MKMIFDEFQGKTAIVTGAASGMGLLCAQRLAENGANVILADANEEGASRAATEIVQKGGSAVAAAVDVRFYDQVEAVARLAMERFGRIDILVNCAGTQYRAPALDFPVEEFDRVMNVNNRAVFIMSKLAAENMMPRGYGKIINIASMQSFFGIPNTPAYAASKGAVAQLTKALGNEWIEKGINVNALAPGWIATKLTKGVTEDPVRTQEIMGRLPAKRWGYPSDFKGPVIFLASAASDYLSGVILPVDGGYLTR